jgi:hypothetical protein
MSWLVVVAVLVIGCLLYMVFFRGDARERKLPDGSILRLQTVFYGKADGYRPNFPERMKSIVGQAWTKWVSKSSAASSSGSRNWYMNATTHVTNDALFLYFNRLDPVTGAYQDVGMQRAEILDEHGCVFLCTQSGGNDSGNTPTAVTPGRGGGGYAIGWFRFEAFPRHEKQFRMRLYDGAAFAEFVVLNPAFAPLRKTDWPIEKFPITRTNGNVAFTLKGIRVEHRPGDLSWGQLPDKIVPEYEVTEDGKPSQNWQALDIELYDSSGNFASEMTEGERYLCPHEGAWKLRVKFFGNEQTRYASNTTWTVRGIQVPEAGKYTNLNTSQVIDGITFKMKVFAGVGDFRYSTGGYITEASPLNKPLEKNKMEFGNKPSFYYMVHGKTPHITVEYGRLDEDKRLTVRGTDDQGREFYGYEIFPWGSTNLKNVPGEVHYLGRRYGGSRPAWICFDLPPDSKKIDLTFCVHTCRIGEFIFKPPTETSPAINNAAK